MPEPLDHPRLTGRVALVTGASRGIGAAVARRLASEGAQLVLTARTVGGLEALDDEIRTAGGLQPSLIPLDLKHLDKVDALGPAIYERFGRLDILVGNAGVLSQLGPVPYSDPQIWQDCFTVNVLANQRLIASVDRLLRASDAGRAVFVTSGTARAAFAYWGAYAASKAALEQMVKIYAAEVTKTNLKVNLVDPGAVRTRMRAQAFPGENPDSLPPPEAITGVFVDLCALDCARHGNVVPA